MDNFFFLIENEILLKIRKERNAFVNASHQKVFRSERKGIILFESQKEEKSGSGKAKEK
jgi:hypothetical protein